MKKNQFLKPEEVRETISKFKKLGKKDLNKIKGGRIINLPGIIATIPDKL
jgi:bacteriocin-like protein